ncbi:MAG TPA: glycosyltransferase [Deltaproteobacteria bacterium]|nr:glycosyltransferase [Deltaproteobacteria bacterium]
MSFLIEDHFIVSMGGAAAAAALAFGSGARRRAALVILSAVLSLRYLAWRGLFTLGGDEWSERALGLALYAAELYGFIQALLFCYQSASPTTPEPPAVPEAELPEVDVFVTIYDEPVEILRRTVLGCLGQDYPEGRFEVHVLDDGGRSEVRALARRLGCRYIGRAGSEHAKAGNINHALALTSRELVALFDCDHVPVRTFLRETAPFFRGGGRLAFLQTAHHFYNDDPFQRALRPGPSPPGEQDLFFHVIQPGRDRYNSAFFTGSCGLFRRSALEQAGGFRTETVTEDIHTSMELHARGYGSLYLNRDLSAGLAPESLEGYLIQRRRWATGAMQLLRLDNPILKRGLTLHQRINYLASNIYFLLGPPRIVYLLSPLFYLLLGKAPLKTELPVFLSIYGAHYLASLLVLSTLGRGMRSAFWSDVYETAMCFTLTAALRSLVSPRRAGFEVTPKGERTAGARAPVRLVAPYAVVFAALAAGVGAGLTELVRNGPAGVTVICLVWTLYNCLLLLPCLAAAGVTFQRRLAPRLARTVEAGLHTGGLALRCRTRDVGEGGVLLSLDEPAGLEGRDAAVELPCGEKTVRLEARALRHDERDGEVVAAFAFTAAPDETAAVLSDLLFGRPESWSGAHDAHPRGAGARVVVAAVALRFAAAHTAALRRLSPRLRAPVPLRCELPAGSGELAVRTIDVGLGGVRIEVRGRRPLPESIWLGLSKDGNGAVEARVVWQRRSLRSVRAGVRFVEQGGGAAIWRAARELS